MFFFNSIKNKKMLEFLIKKGFDINGDTQQIFLYRLLYNIKYEYKNNFIIFDILFKNGLKIRNEKEIAQRLADLDDNIHGNFIPSRCRDFIKRYKDYLDSNIFIILSRLKWGNDEFQKELLDITENVDLYHSIKNYYRGSLDKFYSLFPPEKYGWMDDSKKYNL